MEELTRARAYLPRNEVKHEPVTVAALTHLMSAKFVEFTSDEDLVLVSHRPDGVFAVANRDHVLADVIVAQVHRRCTAAGGRRRRRGYLSSKATDGKPHTGSDLVKIAPAFLIYFTKFLRGGS
jgi:hypothetical protein